MFALTNIDKFGHFRFKTPTVKNGSMENSLSRSVCTLRQTIRLRFIAFQSSKMHFSSDNSSGVHSINMMAPLVCFFLRRRCCCCSHFICTLQRSQGCDVLQISPFTPFSFELNSYVSNSLEHALAHCFLPQIAAIYCILTPGGALLQLRSGMQCA